MRELMHEVRSIIRYSHEKPAPAKKGGTSSHQLWQHANRILHFSGLCYRYWHTRVLCI